MFDTNQTRLVASRIFRFEPKKKTGGQNNSGLSSCTQLNTTIYWSSVGQIIIICPAMSCPTCPWNPSARKVQGALRQEHLALNPSSIMFIVWPSHANLLGAWLMTLGNMVGLVGHVIEWLFLKVLGKYRLVTCFSLPVYDLRRKTALPCCLGIHCVDRSPLTLVARSLNMLLGHRTHHIY